MLEYLDKFKKLPPEIREKISGAEKTKIVGELEAVYGVDLAAFVIRVAIREIYFNNLAANIIKELKLDPKRSVELEADLNTKVFNDIADYLRQGPPKPILPAANPIPTTQKVDLSHLFKKTEGAAPGPILTPEKPKDASRKVDLSHLFLNKEKKEAIPSAEKKPTAPAEEKKAAPAVMPVLPVKEENILPAVIAAPAAVVAPRKPEISKDSIPAVPVVVKKEPLPPFSLPVADSADSEKEIEDKNEIEVFAAKAGELKKDDTFAAEAVRLAFEVGKEVGISFSSSELDSRFRQIVSTYLKGIRGRIDTRESLVKEAVKGGVNLDQLVADKVLKLLDAQLNGVKGQEEKINIKSGQTGTAFIFNDELLKKDSDSGEGTKRIDTRDIDYDLASVLKKTGKLKEPEAAAEKIEEIEEEAKEEETKIEEDRGQAFTKDAVLGEGEEAGGEENIPDQNRPTASLSSSRIDDIKPAPKIMSPIDELYYMDTVVFRRLGPVSADRTAKIKEKINLLAKQGIEKRFEAINAWRESPVNKLYINIGRQSIGEEKSVEEVIEALKADGRDALEKDEFEAVMDLNEDLRF